MDDIKKEIKWNDRLEEYFATTGEKAQSLGWLHKQSESYYSKRTVIIDLPVIVLSTLNGAVSVGSSSLFGDSGFASVGVGAVALVTAILSTIGSYFSWARRAEGHRIASLNYLKLYRFLNIEMSLPREERMRPKDLLKYVKTEYDRLAEISPLVPPPIINDFRKRFRELQGVAFPEETNGLHAIIVYPTNSSNVSRNVDTREGHSGELSAGKPPTTFGESTTSGEQTNLTIRSPSHLPGGTENSSVEDGSIERLPSN